MSVRLRRWQVYSTLGILGLSTVASVYGIVTPDLYRGLDPLRPSMPRAAVTLGIGVPALALGLWTTVRGSIRGYLVWLGALVYLLKTWLSFALTYASNEFHLGYVLLFSLSLFTLAGGLVDCNPTAVSDRLEGRLPTRTVLGSFVVLGPLLAWGLFADGPTTFILDIGVVLPSVGLTVVWLRRGRAWGHVFAVLLLVLTTLDGAVGVATAVQQWLAGLHWMLPQIVFRSAVVAATAGLTAKYLSSPGTADFPDHRTSDSGTERRGR